VGQWRDGVLREGVPTVNPCGAAVEETCPASWTVHTTRGAAAWRQGRGIEGPPLGRGIEGPPLEHVERVPASACPGPPAHEDEGKPPYPR